MSTPLRKLLLLALILAVGATILAPVVIAFEPDRLPGDFLLHWGKQIYVVPVFWSLCASAVLGLLYLFYRR